jgi:hypothetical protein
MNGTPITNETELRENVENYLTQWRSKWSYGKRAAGKGATVSNATASTIKPIFHVHLIATLPESLSATGFKDPAKIQADSFANKEIGEGALFLDEEETSIVHQRYGVMPVKAGAGAIVVVRPDSHLGYRVLGAGPSAWRDVDQYFHTIFS